MGYRATAISSVRVLLKFDSVVADIAALLQGANYNISDLDEEAIPVQTVKKQSTENITSVVLILRAPLDTGRAYTITLNSAILTGDNTPVTPNSAVFTWVGNLDHFSVPLSHFTKIPSSSSAVGVDALALKKGVYFSPAFETSGASSQIEVDEIDVCTKAYDSYEFPKFADPKLLFTYTKGGPSSELGPSVMWAPWHRLEEARRDFTQKYSDSVRAMEHAPAAATLTSVDLTRVSLLNNVSWKLFDNLGTPPDYFKVTNNLIPVGFGPSITFLIGGNFTSVDVSDNSEEFSDIVVTTGPQNFSDIDSITEQLECTVQYGPVPSDTVTATESLERFLELYRSDSATATQQILVLDLEFSDTVTATEQLDPFSFRYPVFFFLI